MGGFDGEGFYLTKEMPETMKHQTLGTWSMNK